VGKNRSKDRRKKEKRKRKRENDSVADQKEGLCEQSEGMKKACLLPCSFTMGEYAPDNKPWTFAELERQWALGRL
jgi:hypothetical protein